MKELMMFSVAAIACVAVAQNSEMSLADARGMIGDAVSNPSKMAEISSQLSAADQVSFLADVNAAIAKMPGSEEEKAAKYVNAAEAALKTAKKNNATAVLAEVFATVPPEALTIVNERLAADLYNRAADPSMTDDKFTSIASDTVSKIQTRCATADNSGVRDTFAILMFIRASNGSPADLRDKLVGQLDPSTADLARNEWIPPALGEGQEKTYEPMLGASDAGNAPEEAVVLRMAGPQVISAMLGDLATSNTMLTDSTFNLDSLGLPEFSEDYGLYRIPRTDDKSKPYWGGAKRGSTPHDGGYSPEPGPYAYQRM